MKTVTVQISESAVKRCLKDESVRELRDPRYPLRLRIHSARTGGSWYLVRYESGAAKWQKLANYPAVQVKTVLEHMQKLAMQGNPSSMDKFSTVRDLLEWYYIRFERDKSISEQRKASVSSAIHKHLIPLVGDCLIHDLDRHSIDQVLLWPLQAEYSPAYVKQIFSTLKTAATRAAKLDMLHCDPYASIKFRDFIQVTFTPKQGAVRPDYVPELFERLSGISWDVRMLVLLMLLFGTRIGETRKARWSDFDRAHGFWHIPEMHTKTRTAHRLPMSDFAWSMLHLYRCWQGEQHYRGDFLFPSGRKCWSAVYASRRIGLVSLGEWTAHDLRKLARTVWADLGIDYMIGELLLNHALTKLDRTYIHTHADNQMRFAVEKYHDWLQGQSDKMLNNQDSAKMVIFMHNLTKASDNAGCGASSAFSREDDALAE